MKSNKLSEKLNNIIAQFNAQNKFGKLQFYCDNYLEQTTKILSEICPCGKIATLYFNSTYFEMGKNFSEHLKQHGYKPVSVILSDNFSNNLDDYAKLFTLPEDVRAIITFDSELNSAVKYFGSIRGINVIHVLTDFTVTDFISPKITINNGDNFETVTLSCNQHVIIDSDLCSVNLAHIYAYTVSKIVNLIDYRIYLKLYSKRFIKAPYDLLSTAINKALTCFNLSLEDRENALIDSLMTAEIANRAMSGDCWCESSENVVKLLLDGKFLGYDRIAFVKYAIGLYQKYFSGEYQNLLEIPDYNQRANSVSSLLKTNEKVVMENLINQIQTYNNSQEIIKQLRPLVLEQLKQIEKLIKQIGSTYHALNGGGRESKTLKTCLFHSGDIGANLNGMSLVRENGILEYLQV